MFKVFKTGNPVRVIESFKLVFKSPTIFNPSSFSITEISRPQIKASQACTYSKIVGAVSPIPVLRPAPPPEPIKSCDRLRRRKLRAVSEFLLGIYGPPDCGIFYRNRGPLLRPNRGLIPKLADIDEVPQFTFMAKFDVAWLRGGNSRHRESIPGPVGIKSPFSGRSLFLINDGIYRRD